MSVEGRLLADMERSGSGYVTLLAHLSALWRAGSVPLRDYLVLTGSGLFTRDGHATPEQHAKLQRYLAAVQALEEDATA